MRRAMEYVRWQLDNWLTQNHGRDWSIFTETKKIAHYVWQSWKRGAFLVLVLAFLPILFPLVLFLSFVGFICAVPLLCGAATYYLFFRNFSLPLSITKFMYPSNCPSEGLIADSQSGEDGMLQGVSFQEVGSRQDETLLKSSAIGEGDAKEVPRRASNAKTILLLECELGNERVEADNREYRNRFKLNVPSEGNHESGVGSSSSVSCHSNAVFQVRGPILLLPPAKLKRQYEQQKDEETWSLHGTGDELSTVALKRKVCNVLGGELSKSGQRETQTGDVDIWGKRADVVDANRTHAYSNPAESSVGVDYFVRGTACTPERRHMVEMDCTPDTGISNGSSMVEVYGEHPSAEPVFSEHTANIAPTGGSSETSGHFCRYAPCGKDCRAGNRMLTGNTEVMTGGTPCSNMHTPGEKVKDWTFRTDSNVPQTLSSSAMSCAEVLDCRPFEERGTNVMHESPPENSSIEASVKSTFTPFSDSALTTISRADSGSVIHIVRPKYWRDEVEDTVLSSAFAKVACIENLECAQEAEVFSASRTSKCGQYKENMVEGENGRIGSSLRFASSLFTHQRRLSFSDVLADDKLVSPGCFFPREKLNDSTPDCKQRSVSTSFCSDYTWSSESSEQGFEFLSTEGTAHEESCVDTASSIAPYDEENKLEPGAVSDSTFFPTPDQLTEDWETRRKRWEEESTLGRLVPLSPYMEAHSVEARSICNPLFEFSTPSPPLKKLKTRDTNHISNSPSLHTRFSKRHSAPPENPRTHARSSGSTPSPHPFRLQKRKSDMYTEPLDSDVFSLTTNTRRHARSYSASFTERVEPFSGEFEGLLGYWRSRDKMAHWLTSSPRHSQTSTSPAELAHRIREEIDAVQVIIGQEIPPQYSLWKEVEALSQIVGMKLPYMGDMSDISKARQGMDLLKIAVDNSCDVE